MTLGLHKSSGERRKSCVFFPADAPWVEGRWPWTMGAICVGPSHIKHRDGGCVLGLALCLVRIAVDGQPADVRHITALRRGGAFRLFSFRALSRLYMERGGKGVWEV